MNLKAIGILYKKELLDVLRDKKTVIVMIVLPLLLYPLLMWGFSVALPMFINHIEEKEYTIAVPEEVWHDEVWNQIASQSEQLTFVTADDPADALEKEEIDAYLTVEETTHQTVLHLTYYAAVTDSDGAANALEDAVAAYAEALSKERVKQNGLQVDEILYPVRVEKEDLSSNEETFGNLFGMVVPLLLIIFIFSATFYPAVDTTAGERERGTMELLVTMPISNLELIMGKFLSVATIAVASTLVNVISIGFMMGMMGNMVNAVSDEPVDIRVTEFLLPMIVIFFCVLVHALFMSALTMCVCAFAKTFKEANNYVSPLMMVLMFTAYIAYIPGIRLTNALSVIPVVNICLLIKDAMAFRFEAGAIFLTLVSNVLYAFLTILALSRIYSTESILFGEGMAKVKFFENRKNIRKGTLPSVQEAVFVFLLLYVLQLYLAGFMAGESIAVLNIVVQLLFAALPLAACWYIRADMKEVFSLNRPKTKQLAVSVLLALGALCVTQAIVQLLAKIFPESLSNVDETFAFLEDTPAWMVVLLIAILPAICEELLFRGYVFTALRKRLQVKRAILLTAFVFGLFHMSVIRFFPTFLLGLLITYVVYRTNSIFPGMLMHFMNNAVSLWLMVYGERFFGK